MICFVLERKNTRASRGWDCIVHYYYYYYYLHTVGSKEKEKVNGRNWIYHVGMEVAERGDQESHR